MPYLEYDHTTRALGPGVLSIGSGTESSWRIVGRDLMPLHVIITLQRDGHAHVERGTGAASIVVNGNERADGRAVLNFGDILQIGTARFTYRQFATDENTGTRPGYLHDTRRGRIYNLGDVTEIGRDVKCAINLQEPEVSRVHAEVLRRPTGGFAAKPVAAAYTLINMKRLNETTTLHEGDEITIGRTVFRFTMEQTSKFTAATIGTGSGVDKRAARMPTMFVGTVQARDMLRKTEQRKYGVIVAIAGAIVLTIVAIIQLLTR